MKKKKGFIIDVKSMQGITFAGEQLTIYELFKIFKEGDVLFWNSDGGHPPIPVDDVNNIKFVDTTTITDEEFERLYGDILDDNIT